MRSRNAQYLLTLLALITAASGIGMSLLFDRTRAETVSEQLRQVLGDLLIM